MPIAAEHPTKLKILLVEDNEDTRLVLAQLLEWDGYEVHCAGTLQAALSTFGPSGSQVVVSDLGLPDGSGWQLLRALGETEIGRASCRERVCSTV